MESYKEIIELLNGQHPSGLAKLYQGYGRAFYSYCIQKWNLSEDEAWEVVYRTLETLVLKIGNYDLLTQTDFDRFVYRVLINFLRQQYRSKKQKEAGQVVYVDFSAESGSNEGFANYLNRDALHSYYDQGGSEHPQLTSLKNALESMEQTDKDLLLLRAQNYSYDEIAKLLGIDNNQLKVKHHRAKKKLIEILNEQSNY